MRKERVFLTFFIILSIIAILFILVPILKLFFSTSPDNLVKILNDNDVWEAIFISVKGAFFATIIGLIIGVPLGYFLSKSEFKGKRLIESIVNVPIVIPHISVGILFLILLNEKTILGKIFGLINITFVDTIYGIIIVMLFVSISFIIVSALNGFSSIDDSIEEAAMTLGADRAYIFFHLQLPLAAPAIISGAVLAFARAVSEVGGLLIIAYYPKSAPILLYERFENYGLVNSKPIASLLVFISLVLFFVTFSISSIKLKRKANHGL